MDFFAMLSCDLSRVASCNVPLSVILGIGGFLRTGHDADLVCVPAVLSARWTGGSSDPHSVLRGSYLFPWKSSLPAPG